MNNWRNKKNRIKLKLKTFPLLFKILYFIWSRINTRIIKTKKEKLQFKNLLNRIEKLGRKISRTRGDSPKLNINI